MLRSKYVLGFKLVCCGLACKNQVYVTSEVRRFGVNWSNTDAEREIETGTESDRSYQSSLESVWSTRVFIAVCSKVGGRVILKYFRTFRRQDFCRPLLDNEPILLYDFIVYCNLLIEL